MAVSSSSSSSSTAALKEGRTAEIIHSVMLCQLEGDNDTPMVVALGDESYAGMCGAIISQTTPAMPCGYELIGGFRATRRDQCRLVFGRDHDGICYCVLTSRYYSHAKACNFLVDVATGLSQASTATRSAVATASTSEGRDIVASLCGEYSSSDSIKTKPSPCPTSPPKVIENQSQQQQPILMLQSIRPTRGDVPPPMKPIPDDSFLIDCSSTSRTSRTLSSSSRSTATTRSLSTTGSRSTVSSSSSSSSSFSFSRWAAEPFAGPRRHKSQNSIAMPLVQQQQQAEQSTSRRTVQFDESSLAASPKQASQPRHNKSSGRSVSTEEDSACPPPPTSPLSRRSVSLDDATIGSSASSTSSRRRRKKKSEDASKAHRASSFASSSRVGGDALLNDSAHQSRQPRKSVQFDESSIVASPKRASQTGRRSRSSRRSVSMDEASVTSSPKPKSMSRRCVSMDDANGSISSSRHSRRSVRMGDDASTIGGGSTCASSYVGGDGLFFWEGLQPHFAEPELFPYHISGGDSVHNFADNSTVASGQSMNDPLGANSWHTRASTTSREY